MKVLFDTSVLIAAFIQKHPHHERAYPWLSKALKKQIKFYVSNHTLAELFAVLTKLPVSPSLSPAIAGKLIRENVEKHAQFVDLNTKDYLSVLDEMETAELTGGIIYDALIVAAAEKAKVDVLLTFNNKHFQAIWPEGRKKIKVPQ